MHAALQHCSSQFSGVLSVFWVVKWFLFRINWILIGGWQKLIDGDASSGTKPDYHQDSLFLSNKVEICFYSIHFETINVNKLHREQRECKLNTKRQLQMHIDCQAMNWVLRKQNSFRIVPTHFSIQCTTCDLLLDTNKAKVFLLPPANAYFLNVLNSYIDTTATGTPLLVFTLSETMTCDTNCHTVVWSQLV